VATDVRDLSQKNMKTESIQFQSDRRSLRIKWTTSAYREMWVLVVQPMVTRCRASATSRSVTGGIVHSCTLTRKIVWRIACHRCRARRKVMCDRSSDKSYWTYGFCVYNLSTLTLKANVSKCLYFYISTTYFVDTILFLDNFTYSVQCSVAWYSCSGTRCLAAMCTLRI
jgi:hypothetical protein